jgi:exonuclease SbcD
MRILHTSDWHLGRTLHKVSLVEAQQAAMQQMAGIAREEAVDLVVVSGDVFDHAVPSAEALELLEGTLAELLTVAPVVITAGNHDSLRRLGYGSRLFTERLFLRTRPEDVGSGISLQDRHGPVRVYPIPYLHPDTARYVLGSIEEPLAPSHAAVLGNAMDRVREDLAHHPGARSVVLAHAWVAGGGGSDSERDISIGGLGTVPCQVFAGVDYVALGHLHGPQEPQSVGSTRLRYSGSPLRYSFSEAGQTKSVSIVELGASGVHDIRERAIDQPRGMARLAGLMDELLDPALHGDDLRSWVSIVVTDDRRPSAMWARLQERFPHVLQIRHEPVSGFATAAPTGRSVEQKPLEVAGEFVEYVTNGPIEPAESEAFDRAVQVVREGEHA